MKGCAAQPTYVTWADHVYNPWISRARTVAPATGVWVEDERSLESGGAADVMRWAADAGEFRKRVGRRPRLFAGPWCWALEKGRDHERESLWQLVRESPDVDWLMLFDAAAEKAPARPPAERLDNLWVGTKLTGGGAGRALSFLKAMPVARRFVLISPLLGDLGELDLGGVDWAVVSTAQAPADDAALASFRLLCMGYGVSCWFEEADELGVVRDYADRSCQEPRLPPGERA